MYTPRNYRVTEPAVLRDFIRRHGFGTIFSWSDEGPMATHLPFELRPSEGPHGTLAAHFARANPHWRALTADREVLVSFVGPHAYVSPTWYEKPAEVPTWNYAAVHAYGVPRLEQDPGWLREHVLRLVELYEGGLTPRWDPVHAEPLLPTMMKAIVGVTITISRMLASFKLSQNRSVSDQWGVVKALERGDDPLGRDVADLMRANLRSVAANNPAPMRSGRRADSADPP